jgi:hypothetical protein
VDPAESGIISKVFLKECGVEIFQLDFALPTSCERPFKVPGHLVWVLEIDKIIAMSDITFIVQCRNRHGHRHGHFS